MPLLRKCFLSILLSVALSPALAADSVLWVGNSRTYVGNLPEVYKALVRAADKREIVAEMLVEGGGELAGRVEDGSVARELDAAHYDAVLLQEHGHYLKCGSGGFNDPKICPASLAAHKKLAALVQQHGAKAVLMGTMYFVRPSAAEVRMQERGEQAFAQQIHSDGWVEIGNAVLAGMRSEPAWEWIYEDGAHGGHDTTLMMAILTYRHLEGRWPAAVDVPLDYRDYPLSVGFGAEELGGQENLHIPPSKRIVSAAHLARLIALARKAAKLR